jgi:thiosulfate:glutathione sulfurtransferase
VPEIKEALQMPAQDFKQKYGFEQPKKDTPLVFACGIGARSRKALDAAIELGFTE